LQERNPRVQRESPVGNSWAWHFKKFLSENSGSRGDEYEDDSLLGCCDVTDVSEVLTASVIRTIIRAFVALMMEAVSTSETSVNFYKASRRIIPEDSHLKKFYFISSVTFLQMIIPDVILFILS
jgi:hypothetical protein